MGLLRGRSKQLEAEAEALKAAAAASQRARENWQRAFKVAKRHLASERASAAAASAKAADDRATAWRHVRVAALVHRAEGLPGQLADRAFVKAHVVQQGARAKARQSTTTQRLASGLDGAAAAIAAAASAAPPSPSSGGGLACSWQEMLTVEALLPLVALDENDSKNKPPLSSSSRARLAASARRQGLELALRVKAARALAPDVVLGEARIPLADVIEHPDAWSAPRWLPLLASAPEGSGGVAGRLRAQLFLSRSALPDSLRVLCATWNVGNAVPPSPQELREHWFRLPPLPAEDEDDGGGEGAAAGDNTEPGGDANNNNTTNNNDQLPHLVFIGAQECNFARESAKLLKQARSLKKGGATKQQHGEGGGGNDGAHDDDDEPENLRERGVIAAAAAADDGTGGARRSRSWRASWRGRRREGSATSATGLAAGAPGAGSAQPAAPVLSPSASIVAAADAVAALYEASDDPSLSSSSSDDDSDDGAPGKWRGRGASPRRRDPRRQELEPAEEGDHTRAAPMALASSQQQQQQAALWPTFSSRLKMQPSGLANNSTNRSLNGSATTTTLRGSSPVAGRSPTRQAASSVGLGGAWETGDGRAPPALLGGSSPPPADSAPFPVPPPPAPPPAASAAASSLPGAAALPVSGGFAAGLRAQVDSAREWEACCSAALGKDYFLVGARHMFQTRALLFARADVVPDVARVRTDSEATGIGRVAPNKGGVCVAARVGATDLVFINAHLAAHQSRAAAREADLAEIVGSLLQQPDGGGGEGGGAGSAAATSSSSAAPRWGSAGGGANGGRARKWWQVGRRTTTASASSAPAADGTNNDNASAASAAAAQAAALLHRLPLGVPGADVCTGFSHAFWVGDLNFRVDYGSLEKEPKDTPHEEDWTAIAAAAARRDFPPLREKDQLLRAQRQGRIFAGWSEADLTFPPTFKVSKDRVGERYARKRAPAWTDRVLFRSALPHAPARALRYWSAPQVPTSDHKPVAALIDVPVCSRTVAAAAAGYGAAGGGVAVAAGAAAAAVARPPAASTMASSFSARGLRARSAALLSRRGGTGAGVGGLRTPSAFGGLLGGGGRAHAAHHQQQQVDPEAVAVPYRFIVSSCALPADAATWAALLREAATADGAVAASAEAAPAAAAAGALDKGPAAADSAAAAAASAQDFWQLSVRLELRGACLSRDQAIGGARKGPGGAAMGLLRRALLTAGDGGAGQPPRAKLGQAVARTAGTATLERTDGEDKAALELLPLATGGSSSSGGAAAAAPAAVLQGPSALSAALLPARLSDLEDERLVLCVVARRVAPAEGTTVEAEGGERVVARGVVPLKPAVAALRAHGKGGRGGAAAAAVAVPLERCGRRVADARLQVRLVEAAKVDSLAASAAQRMMGLIHQR